MRHATLPPWPQSLEQKIDALTTIVERGFSAVAEDIAGIKRDMVTKADLADLKVELDAKLEKLATKSDISALSRELESIKQELANVRGFGKEIDHALEGIAAIEKHLGIEKKIAA